MAFGSAVCQDTAPEAQIGKSFLLLFFKKEVLSFLFFFEKKNQKTFGCLASA
jgi:hypothetical protein